MRIQSQKANWLLADTFDSIILSESAMDKEPKFPLILSFPDFAPDDSSKEKAFSTKENAEKTATRFGAKLKTWSTSPNKYSEFKLEFADRESFVKFCSWLGIKSSKLAFKNTKKTVTLGQADSEGVVSVINEAEEIEKDDEDAIDVDKALKVLAKIEKYSEKLEDEKLEKLVADLKKALGAEDEEEETEEKAEKGSNKPKADLDDLDDLEG